MLLASLATSPFCMFRMFISDVWGTLDTWDSGPLSKLDLSNNNLRSEGLFVVSEALKSTSIKQLNIAENRLAFNQQGHKDMSGVIKFAEDMKDIQSLVSLSLSKNGLGAEGARHVAGVPPQW